MISPTRAPADHSAFKPFPVRTVYLGRGVSIAVHISRPLQRHDIPLVCLAGYHRNMSDFTGFTRIAPSQGLGDTPVITLDFAGRGRSGWRKGNQTYTSTEDAHDVSAVLNAIGVSTAVFMGMGYGGQVLMALAASRPTLIAGAILIDAGPVSDPRGLVRLRNNLDHIAATRGDKHMRGVMHQILGADYPDRDEDFLDELTLRTHYFARNRQLKPLFDPKLLKQLAAFGPDDIFEPQWVLFDMLGHAPLMLIRTQLSDQLRRETFEQMCRERSDAISLTIQGQGSPALLDGTDEVGAIVEFAHYCIKARR